MVMKIDIIDIYGVRRALMREMRDNIQSLGSAHGSDKLWVKLKSDEDSSEFFCHFIAHKNLYQLFYWEMQSQEKFKKFRHACVTS